MRFRNREDAGRKLAGLVAARGGGPDALVLGLPRGGVPVAFEVAKALDAPMDVFLVRKLGLPSYEELAMGAIASGGIRVLNQDVITSYGITAATLEAVTRREARELERRETMYRRNRPPLPVADRKVILVDDGVATGASMRAAIETLRALHPRVIIVAIPVAPPSTLRELESAADQVICLHAADPFDAVGAFYDAFDQTSDAEVTDCLRRARSPAVEVLPGPR